MLSEELISEVVKLQNQKVKSRDASLQREALRNIKVYNNFAIILTGIRRCGKSTLMLQLLKQQTSSAFYLNFEDTRLSGFENDDYRRLEKIIMASKSKILVFDEIQVMPNWELFVRQLLDSKFKVIITGSNASLLSSELGTKLTGRHIDYELFPFSYSEFLEFKKFKNSEKALLKYLYSGGFPEYLKTENETLLNQLLNDIIHRDISIRYGIRDVQSLRKLAVYLISNIGKEVSANNLKNVLDIKATSTVLEYFSFLESTYVVQFVPLFSHSLKKQIRNAKKVYTIDMGLFTHNSIVFTDDLGRRLENLVYLHLRHFYSEIYYFKEKKECDFVVFEKGKLKDLIQVCYELLEDNLQREINGIVEAMMFFKVKKATIVTFNQTDTFYKDDLVINVVPAHQFLI